MLGVLISHTPSKYGLSIPGAPDLPRRTRKELPVNAHLASDGSIRSQDTKRLVSATLTERLLLEPSSELSALPEGGVLSIR